MAKKMIDLRSDTVTKPTDEMRAAMSAAEVGDDVMGEDPTVSLLEKTAAEMLGKEAGLFVASGAMGNLLAILVHCSRRDSEMIVGDRSHIHIYEQGNSSTLGHVHSRTVPTNVNGTLDLKTIESLIRTRDDHFPITQLICLENTHNMMGGVALTAEYTDSVGNLAKKYGIKLHLDGARLFNASVALGVPAKRLAQACDSVSVCLSKGLGSPIGSVLCGTKSFCLEAKRYRKALGGGWRQAGVLAACGLISLTKMVNRLSEDHENCAILASKLAKIPGIKLLTHNTSDYKFSNIIFFSLDQDILNLTASELSQQLKQLPPPQLPIYSGAHGDRIRFVTNYHFTKQHIQPVADAVLAICSKHQRSPKSRL